MEQMEFNFWDEYVEPIIPNMILGTCYLFSQSSLRTLEELGYLKKLPNGYLFIKNKDYRIVTNSLGRSYKVFMKHKSFECNQGTEITLFSYSLPKKICFHED